MAIDFRRSFSIREFASKMRSVDVEKSWPFVREGDELPKEEKDRMLPPMVCKKYRWWDDELKAARLEKPETERPGKEAPEEDPTVKICPVCGTFTASTMNAVNAHIDSCLSQASKDDRRKAKSRGPKKRSIVEIFAVAPQIERQEEDDDDDDEDDEDGEDREEEGGRLDGEEEDAAVFNVSSSLEAAGLKVHKRKRNVTKIRKDLAETMATQTKHKKKRRNNKLKIKKNLLKKKKKKNIVKKKKKQQHSSGILAFSDRLLTEKEGIHKLKMSSSIDHCEPQQGSFQNKRSGKEVTNPVGIQKKKQSKFQGLAKKYGHKVKASKSSADVLEDTHVLPLQSILKSQTGVSSVQITNATCNTLNGNSKNSQKIQPSDKRVRFSGKDDILGHKKKPCSSIELPQVQCLRKAYTDVSMDSSAKDQSVAGDSFFIDTVVTTEASENEKDDALSVVSVSEEAHSHEKRQFTSVPTPVVLHCHDKEKTSLDESVDLNEAVQQYDSLHQFNPGSSISDNLSSVPTVINPTPKGVTCQMETQEEGSIQMKMSTGRNFPEQRMFPIARPAFSTLPNPTRNPSSQPFLPCLANDQEPIEKQPYTLQAIRPQDCNGWDSQYRPLTHLTPNKGNIRSTSAELKKQLASKNGSFVATRVVSDPISVCRDKTTDDDFIGLPLNSQGEFVQTHSNGRPGFNQLFKKQNATIASVGSLQVHNVLEFTSTMDHSSTKEKFHTGLTFPSLKCLPERGYLKDIPAKFPIQSRPTGLQGIRRSQVPCPSAKRERVQSASHLGLEMNLMSHSSSSHGEYKQSHRHSENDKNQAQGNLDSGFQPSSQPTMRLMGKNVTVGISNNEGRGSEDGKIWIDKEIITEHPPISAISGISRAGNGNQPELVIHNATGTSNASEICFMEAPSILQVAALGTRPTQTNLNRQTHVMLMNGLPLIDGNHGADFHPSGQQIPSQAMLHKSSNFSENHLSGNEAFKISNQIPITLSNPHSRHLQHVLLSSAQCKPSQSVSFSATVPFSDEDRREYLTTSCTQRPSPSLPPWLQNASQLKEIPYPLAHPAVQNSKHEPRAMLGTNFLRQPPSLAISFPCQSSSTYPGLQNVSTPASLPHHPFIPAFPRFCPSAIGTSFRNRTMGNKTNAKSASQDVDVAKKAKKRPAARTDETVKIAKKPNLAIQEEPSASAGPQKGEYLHGYTRYNTVSAVLRDQGDKPEMGFEKDDLRTASGTNAFKLDSVARSGPIKLSAGAKHILKPCQNMDQDSSRPTHSTIPFAIVGDSGKLPEVQRKTAKIYRF